MGRGITEMSALKRSSQSWRGGGTRGALLHYSDILNFVVARGVPPGPAYLHLSLVSNWLEHGVPGDGIAPVRNSVPVTNTKAPVSNIL